MDLAAALRAFIRTVERGSVTAAARDLGVSQPAITKHLRNLERHVGARLVERSARIVRPTSLGQTLYEASRLALTTIDAALEGVRRDMGEIEGLLRVHAPTCIGARQLHQIVLEFQKKFPTVTVDLVLEDRTVDLVCENFDIGVKYGRPEGQEIIIRRLGMVRRILVASPKFLAKVGPINSIERLAEVDVITTAAVLSPRDTLTLQQNGDSFETNVRAILRTNNAVVITNTLVGGHAAGPVQHLLVLDELADGRLVRILPEFEVKSQDIFWAYPSVRFMRPAVRAFTDFVVPALRAVEGIDASEQPAMLDRALRRTVIPQPDPKRIPLPGAVVSSQRRARSRLPRMTPSNRKHGNPERLDHDAPKIRRNVLRTRSKVGQRSIGSEYAAQPRRQAERRFTRWRARPASREGMNDAAFAISTFGNGALARRRQLTFNGLRIVRKTFGDAARHLADMDIFAAGLQPSRISAAAATLDIFKLRHGYSRSRYNRNIVDAILFIANDCL